MKQSPTTPVFPLFLAAFPVLLFFEANPDFFFTASQIIGPLLLSVGLTAIVGLLVGLATQSARQGTLAATLFALWFPNHWAVAATVQALWFRLGFSGAPHQVLMIVVVGVAYFLVARHRLEPVGRFVPALNVATAALCAVPALRILVRHDPGPLQPLSLYDGPIPGEKAGAGARPSIVLLLLDRYSGAESLKAYWGYDNGPFLQGLRERGFVVADHPRTNYPLSVLSLASMLNGNYLEDAVAGRDTTDQGWARAYTLSQDNAAAQLLRRAGYRYVLYPTWFGSSRSSRLADSTVRPPWRVRDWLESAWYDRTPVPETASVVCRVVDCAALSREDPRHPAKWDWEFESLARLRFDQGPLFVVAHLILPHDPFVLDAQCRHRWSARRSERVLDSVRVASQYLAQLECLNSRLLGLIDEWSKWSDPPPMILVQSDHGFGWWQDWVPTLDRASEPMIFSRMDALTAYRLSGRSPEGPVRTPVNLLRMAVNQALGLHLPLFTDRYVWAPGARPYDFVDLDRGRILRPAPLTPDTPK